MKKVTLPENYQKAIRNSSTLAYLWSETEATPYTIKKEVRALLHGSVLKKSGEFIDCLLSSANLPAGTQGFLFVSHKISYSAYQWIGDEQWPAVGADRILNGAHYTFVTFVELAGRQVLADHFCSIDYKPRIIGKV